MKLPIKILILSFPIFHYYLVLAFYIWIIFIPYEDDDAGCCHECFMENYMSLNNNSLQPAGS